jgi:hypothetical protein
MTMRDFVFTSHGSVIHVRAVSEAARAFAEENFPVEDWQGSPCDFCTDHRAAHQLAEQLLGEGWAVE